MNEKELKTLIKETMNMTRVPKNLNIFYCFYKSYRLQQDRQLDTISSTLTTGAYIPTSILQKRFGFRTKHYQPYFDCFVEEMSDEYVAGKQCRIITKWSQKFLDLMATVGKIKLPVDFYEKYYYSTVRLTAKQRSVLKDILNNIKNKNVYTISSTLTNTIEQTLEEDVWHSTENSPYRIYSAVLNISKEDRKKMFAGNYDVDIESCFSAIAWNLLDMSNCELPYAYLINPAMKRQLRQKIMDEKGWTEKKAKEKVQYLFTDKVNCTKDIEWLNVLHLEINRRVKISYTNELDSHHKYFTYHEQQIIEKYVKENNLEVILPIHDGFITNAKPTELNVNYQGYDFSFSCDKFEFVNTNTEAPNSQSEALPTPQVCNDIENTVEPQYDALEKLIFEDWDNIFRGEMK